MIDCYETINNQPMQNPYLEQKGPKTALDCFIVLYSITNLLAPIVVGDMIKGIAWFDRLIYPSVTMFRTHVLIFLIPLEILAIFCANIWLGYRFAEYRWIIFATILANLFATAFSGEYTIFLGLVTWSPRRPKRAVVNRVILAQSLSRPGRPDPASSIRRPHTSQDNVGLFVFLRSCPSRRIPPFQHIRLLK